MKNCKEMYNSFALVDLSQLREESELTGVNRNFHCTTKTWFKKTTKTSDFNVCMVKIPEERTE